MHRNVVARFRASDRIQDWRVKEMVEVTERYFTSFLSRGEPEDTSVLTEDATRTDGGGGRPPTVGRAALAEHARGLRERAPGLEARALEYGLVDAGALLVQWEVRWEGREAAEGGPPTRREAAAPGSPDEGPPSPAPHGDAETPTASLTSEPASFRVASLLRFAPDSRLIASIEDYGLSLGTSR